LTNASPGVFFTLCGVLILWRYKPRINSNVQVTTEAARNDISKAASVALHSLREMESRHSTPGTVSIVEKITYHDRSER
jgi:hypothetical protein